MLEKIKKKVKLQLVHAVFNLENFLWLRCKPINIGNFILKATSQELGEIFNFW